MAGDIQTYGDSIHHKLTSKTPFFSLKLYVVIGLIAACIVAAVSLLIILLCLRANRISRNRRLLVKHSSGLIPLVSKEILEIKTLDRTENIEKEEVKLGNLKPKNEIEIEGEKKNELENDAASGSTSNSDVSVDEKNIGWGHWYSWKELEVATRGFSQENVIGQGGYGIVYRGVLQDGSVVAVKILLNKKYVNLESLIH